MCEPGKPCPPGEDDGDDNIVRKMVRRLIDTVEQSMKDNQPHLHAWIETVGHEKGMLVSAASGLGTVLKMHGEADIALSMLASLAKAAGVTPEDLAGMRKAMEADKLEATGRAKVKEGDDA